MNVEATFRPIDHWPGTLTPPGKRQRARFKAGRSDTMELLQRELRHLGARSVVIQLDLRERDIRLDGWPRADARPPGHPGVVLAFQSKHGPLKYPCDTFTDWRDNLRAIALALEALRKVDRYGVTRRGEQYRGWKALPGGENAVQVQTPEDAARWLASVDGWAGLEEGASVDEQTAQILGVPDHYRAAYRHAARKLHPGAGGDTQQFSMLQQVRGILDQHHGLK